MTQKHFHNYGHAPHQVEDDFDQIEVSDLLRILAA